jgi:hypothetical protein
MFYVLNEARADPDRSEWARELIEEWSDVVRSTSLGTVYTRLDYFAEHPDDREKLIQHAEAALGRLRSEKTVSVELLSKERVGGEVHYYEDIPSEKIVGIGEKFLRLLRGEPIEP